MRQTFADILKSQVQDCRAKVEEKLPSWASVEGLQFPSSLCLEQCSGEFAALHKAELAGRLCGPGFRIADLTGGLGVDDWAFSRKASEVFYNERNCGLRQAVKRNFALLGVRGVQFHGFDISPRATDWVEAIEEFGPDIIYADPARRASTGQKVFRPEDCEPDVVQILPTLLRLTPLVLLKLSPMADIAVLEKALRPSEIQVVGANGEVKELLCVVRREPSDHAIIKAVEEDGEFAFTREEEALAQPLYGVPGRYLLEPKAVILKAGAFRLCCSRWGLRKLAPSTHLYTSDTLPGTPLFKVFEVIGALPFSGASIKEAGRMYPHAEVSARNLPLKTDALRARLGIKPGPSGGIHIFGCECPEGRSLIVTRKI